MLTIILDTNFILYCVRFKIDVHSELSRIINEPYTISVLDKTLTELTNKKDQRMALKLIQGSFNIISTNSKKSVDSLLLEQKDAIIATQDKELKLRLKQKGLKIVVIRQKNHLELI